MKYIKMNCEESRLRTFRNWPSNAPVDARRIAKAGFYYMGQNLEVQCFSCGGRISEWNYNDKVMTRHRALDPKCPFILSPALSGNVPVGSVSQDERLENQRGRRVDLGQLSQGIEAPETNQSLSDRHLQESDTDNPMHLEAERLKTFSNWPVPFIVTPSCLAEAGFYSVHQGDKVKCAYCSVIIGRWEAGDNPMTEHLRHSPNCRFLRLHSHKPSTSGRETTNSSGITFRENCDDHSDSTMRSLGVKIHKVAKHPKYNNKETRIATYTLWPRNIPQTPEDLAEAGFYYAGNEDQVRCFHCDGGLRQWEPNDDPWIEHARWFPDCGYVISAKGEQFVEEAKQQYPPLVPEMNAWRMTKVSESRTPNDSSHLHQVLEEDLELLMSSSTAIAALQIGLDFSRVKMAIRQKLEQTGVPFSSSHDLVEAALDIQHDETTFQDSEDIWSTPLNSPLHTKRANPRSTKVLQSILRETESSDSDSADTCVGQVTAQLKLKSSETANPDDTTCKKVTLEEENRRLREARLCKICMDNEVCIVFLPCGHLVTCVNCAHSLAACPVCRQDIKATVRTFLS